MVAPPMSSRALVVVAILLTMFMSAMEATVVATAMPTVVADLRGIELYGWVGAIYTLASTLTIPVWGAASDLRGRRPVLLAGLVLFLVGSLLSGAAHTMTFLVVARAVQGAGAGALQTVPLTIVGDLFRIEERGRLQAAFGAVWGSAAVVGPLLGGVIVHALSWRWVFYINLPFGLVAAVMFVAFFREQPRRDPAASVRSDVWSALRLPVVVAANAASVLTGAAMMATLFFLPLYAQSARSASPTEAGVSVAPMLLGWPMASVVSGRSLPRVGARPLVRAGTTAVLVGTVALFALVHAGAPMLLIQGAVFVYGVGMGLATPAMLIAVQENVSWAQRGSATASMIFARSVGGAAAVGALGAVLSRSLAGKVDEEKLNTLLGPTRGHGLSATDVASLTHAMGEATGSLFAAVALFGVLAAVVGWLFPALKLTGSRASTPPVAVE
jgi:MFS family permease